MTDGIRQFPCTQCGAKVEFAPGTDSLVCPYCGHRTEIPASKDGIEERDFSEGLAALEDSATMEEVQSVACASCAAAICCANAALSPSSSRASAYVCSARSYLPRAYSSCRQGCSITYRFPYRK